MHGAGWSVNRLLYIRTLVFDRKDGNVNDCQ